MSTDLACTVVGRGELSHIILIHNSISRQHLALIWAAEDGSASQILTAVDLFSVSGTKLNGTKMEPGCVYRVFDNDTLQLAADPTLIRVSGIVAKRENQPVQAIARHKRKSREEPESAASAKRTQLDRPKKMRCFHLLVKHAGSRRPFSSRVNVTQPITLLQSEAEKLLMSHRALIIERANQLQRQHSQLSGDSSQNLVIGYDALLTAFMECAQLYSDCSSFKRGGDLGEFEYEMMQPAFSEASAALAPGTMSESPVVTDSGVHIILRCPL